MRRVQPQNRKKSIPSRRPRPVSKVDWESDPEEHENPDWLVGAN
jgi:hypothetical protein